MKTHKPLAPTLALLACLAAAAAVHAAPAQTPTPPAAPHSTVIDLPGTPNSRHAQKQHYVVLVSLDGFRYDYPTKWSTTHIAALARAGATAPEGMTPSYPSITFPNHITLVTGLLPEHHGIINNRFYDPTRKESYSYKEAKTNTDGTWYTGTPLWSLAEQQHMRAASFFWPGSEALIAGERPDDYVPFEDKFPDEARLDQIITWLRLPPAQRPHLITLYYSNTDHAGHDFGPNSPEVEAQVHHVDSLMGTLREKLDATGLPVDLIIVADHGMTTVEGTWITLDQFADLTNFKTDGWLLYPNSEADAAAAYASFRAHPDPRFTVYRRADVPAYLHYTDSPREGDPVIVPNGPYVFRAHVNTSKLPTGDHGYDVTRMPEMKALFVANGPDIRPGTQLPTFPNVDIYDFISKLLNLKAAKNDGTLTPLKPALKK
ncbi:alkaline phosphatase family protein [Granulicella tundricola]|nr:ectonucleotide pyrophosphatase/phosphodiesterase [Granulicella tundricola]